MLFNFFERPTLQPEQMEVAVDKLRGRYVTGAVQSDARLADSEGTTVSQLR